MKIWPLEDVFLILSTLKGWAELKIITHNKIYSETHSVSIFKQKSFAWVHVEIDPNFNFVDGAEKLWHTLPTLESNMHILGIKYKNYPVLGPLRFLVETEACTDPPSPSLYFANRSQSTFIFTPLLQKRFLLLLTASPSPLFWRRIIRIQSATVIAGQVSNASSGTALTLLTNTSFIS